MKCGRKRSLKRFGQVGLSLVLVLSGLGCSSSRDKSGDDEGAGPNAGVGNSYSADVDGFARLDLSALPDSARKTQFQQIFGGTDAASVQTYYNDRVHHAYTRNELRTASMTPADPQALSNSRWSTPAPQPSSSPVPAPTQGAKAEVGALNISTELWLDGVVNKVPITLTVQGTSIPIDSTRAGVIELGPGYKTTETEESGRVITLPEAYRQSILVHEARHSDCTGGLSAAELSIMQNATSFEDFLAHVPLPHCGHTHIICQDGTYEGLAACDAEKFGAYRVGALYADVLTDFQADEEASTIMSIVATDFYSRYIESAESAATPDTPDMSSGGLN